MRRWIGIGASALLSLSSTHAEGTRWSGAGFYEYFCRYDCMLVGGPHKTMETCQKSLEELQDPAESWGQDSKVRFGCHYFAAKPVNTKHFRLDENPARPD